jgi:glycosyltransferase involved in cell wall biosynthesis
MQNPLVSIIVPCYKQAQYLPEALASVLAQTYPYWECIIVNDGSPDNTEEVAKLYCERDNRFKYVYKRNEGPSSARNLGIHQSKGDYITFIDADDWVDKDYLQNFANMLEINPESHLTESALWMYDNGTIEPMPDKGCFFFSVWGNLFVLQIVLDNKIRFQEDLFWGEDTLFCLEYMRYVPSVKYMSNYTYHYRVISSNSLSAKVLLSQRMLFYSELCEITKEDYIRNNDDLMNVVIHQKQFNMNIILMEISLMTELEKQKWMPQIPIDSFTIESSAQLLLATNKQNTLLKNQLEQIKLSYAYRIGKIILKPFSFIKRRIINIP